MTKAIRALLVEDNPGDARLIREMLLDSPGERFVLDPVATLGEGLDHIRHHTYDTILLDLSLPDSHGIDTLLKVAEVASGTAIVVLTGLDDEDVGIESVQRGAQDYLPKAEVSSRLLVRSIRYAIERHRAERALRQSEKEYRSLIDDVFDTSMVAVLILDRHFQVIWCNEVTEIYFGIGRERLLHMDKRQLVDSELKCIFADPDDYATRILKAYAERTFTGRFECHVLPDGNREERWLEHWSQPIRDGMFGGGRIEQYTDITDRKLLEFAEREQREFAEALHDISTVLTSSLDLNDVLDKILANLGRVVPHDSASISIIEDDHFRIATGDKLDTQEIVAINPPQLDYKPYADMMVKTRQPLIDADMQQDSHLETGAAHAYVGAPIQLNDEVIGFIHLVSHNARFFNEGHAERLVAFARLAAIAIQNARLFSQSQQLAAFEERQRLARELHDSVSQTLFTCRTMSESALRRWKRDPVRAYELVHDVNQLASTALAEMRILLLELRPHTLTGGNLKQLFEQYLQPIQERREFDLNLTIDDVQTLSPEVQIALYRITQEALNNIDKHAQASHVVVRVVDNRDQVILDIRDNGRGFDLEQAFSTRLGLGIMRERAEEIGASIRISSKVGEGTQIVVVWERERPS